MPKAVIVNESADQCCRLHRLLIGGEPHTEQMRLYEAFPSVLGFSSKQSSTPLFEAVLVLALHQAGKKTGEKNFHKVYFLAPANLAESWVVAEFKTAAKRIFGRLKTGKSVEAVKHVGTLFHQVMLGSQVFSLPNEPDYWVAFGFTRSDPVPEWLRNKLMDTGAETDQDLHPGV